MTRVVSAVVFALVVLLALAWFLRAWVRESVTDRDLPAEGGGAE